MQGSEMSVQQIIDGLKDLAYDREFLTSEPNDIFAQDKQVLEQAIDLLHDAYGQKEPMTLEELLALERPWPLWVERIGYSGPALTPAILYNTYTIDKLVTLNNLSFDAANYNRSWRCWLLHPTDAEREAAPWKEAQP